MNRIYDEHGNWWVENQIVSKHGGLNSSDTMSKQQRQVHKEILSVPTYVKANANT